MALRATDFEQPESERFTKRWPEAGGPDQVPPSRPSSERCALAGDHVVNAVGNGLSDGELHAGHGGQALSDASGPRLSVLGAVRD